MELVDYSLHFGAGHRAYFKLLALDLAPELGVKHRLIEGFPKQREAITRKIRGAREGPGQQALR